MEYLLRLLRRTWAGLGNRAFATVAALVVLACVLLAGAVTLAMHKLSQGRQLLRQLALSAEQHRWIDAYIDGTLLVICAIAIGGVALVVAALHRYRQAVRTDPQAPTYSQLRAALDRAAASEVARQHSLGQLSLASEHISIWEWDLLKDELRFTEGTDFTNRAGVSKCSGAEFVQRFVHPEDRSALHDACRTWLPKTSGKNQFSHRYRLLHIDGSTHHVQFHARIQRDGSGRATCLFGVDIDVSFEVQAALELKQQAEQLQAVERRLERASRSSMEGHWETDMVSGQTWMSASLLALLGYDQSMQVVDWQDFAARMVHPDDLTEYNRVLSKHLKYGTPYDVRVRFLRGDGHYQWTAVLGALEHEADGKQLRMAGSSRNVHEQQLAEFELQAMQARFERAIRGTRDGLFDLDLKTRQFWVSPRLWELVGYDPASMPREINDHYRFVHPDDVAMLDEALIAHCERGLSYDIEYRLQHRCGDWLWVRARAVAERDAHGVALRISGSIHDISEARAAREALISATQEAEAANRAKSTFLATMSHEIRTPMNGLIGMTDLLLDTPLERTQRDYAETIRASSDSLLAIINDVLDFTKIEAGKLQVERIEMSVHGLVDDVASVMALQAAAKGVELIIDVHAEVPASVLGDPQRIRQCLSNLLGNAVKFTASGEILVEVSQRLAQDGHSLTHFCVRDTGIGMSAEATTGLFQPFVQADSSTTRKFGGTGLGLSIVKRLVEIMGGQVGLESVAGIGSTFWFSLPLAEISPPVAPSVAVAGERAARILIVDGNASQRRVISMQLARCGYECATAATGGEALTALRSAVTEQRTFDVVLLDRQLGNVDGEQFGREVHADAQLLESRLVLMTTVDGGNRKRFEELGFAAYLTKPLRASELNACLQRALARPARDWHLRTASIVTSRASSARAHYSGHVLVVEDNPVNQKVAQKFVERLGCSVLIARNGAEAVALYARQHFDLILMDMEMPVMDGITATGRIRELEAIAGRRTPIVALTANALSEQMERCLSAGMDAFLSKPIEPAKLQGILARFLSEAPPVAATAQASG